MDEDDGQEHVTPPLVDWAELFLGTIVVLVAIGFLLFFLFFG
jgi:hypothetical protein